MTTRTHTLEPHVETLYRVAFVLTGDAAEAEAAVRDVLARGVDRLSDPPGPNLRHVLLRLLLVALRRPLTSTEPHAAASGTAPDRQPGNDVIRTLVTLDATHREPLVLVDVVGLRYDEAAAVLGVSRRTFVKRLHRARTTIRGTM